MTPRTLILQRARAEAQGIVFESSGGMPQALSDGCFLLAVPLDLDVSPGVTLCREFHRDAAPGRPDLHPYQGFRALEGIYFDREHFQTEHLLLDGRGRERHCPPEVVMMADRMHALALKVLRATMAEVGIDPALWWRVTGGAVDGCGTHWFAASHYRSERELLGCAPHKDTGFVTVLYVEDEGLEADVRGAWASIDPEPGYFIVNFGGAFELLTRNISRPVTAMLHRVRRCIPLPGAADRFSFAAFVNPPPAGDLYQMAADGRASPVQSVESFLREFNRTTWSDRHDDFGIMAPSVSGETPPSPGAPS